MKAFISMSSNSNGESGSPIKVLDGEFKGCYKIIAGGLNVVNSEGITFPDTDIVRGLFTNSTMSRMMKKGVLKGEAEHPARQPGESDESFGRRFISIDSKNVSHLIRHIEILPRTKMAGQPNMVCPVVIYIEPIGEYMEALKSDLENPNSSTSFSIRCLSKLVRTPSGPIRNIFHLITWDWVTEPGISIANQRDTNKVVKSNHMTNESFLMPIEDFKNMLTNDGSIFTKENTSFTIEDFNNCENSHSCDFIKRWK